MATTATKTARRSAAAKRKAAPAKAPRKRTATAPRAATQGNRAAAPAAPASDKKRDEAAVHKAPKLKLVRDSFTIPRDEYGAIDALKVRAAKLGRIAKKSELLRAGLKVLAASTDAGLLGALDAVPPVKTGRPKGKRHGKEAGNAVTATPARSA